MTLPRPRAPRLAGGFALAAAPALAADPAPGAAGMLQTLPALGLVLLVIVGLAWLARRAGLARPAGTGRMKIVDQRSIGARERVVIVEVGEQWLVLGVAPGSVRRLSRLARPQTVAAPVPETTGAAHPFAAWLDRARART